MTGQPNTIDNILGQLMIQDNGCWIYPSLNYRGYGQVRYQGKVVKVHILVWEYLRGKRPDGLDPDHTCEVKACANPDHIDWKTHQEHGRVSAYRRWQRKISV